jgi:hypothetical protein
MVMGQALHLSQFLTKTQVFKCPSNLHRAPGKVYEWFAFVPPLIG